MTDLIDREAVLPILAGLARTQGEYDASYDKLMQIPSANRWIPCSERLPEDFVWCLVCMSDGCIRIGKWNGEYDEQGVWWVSHPNSGGKLYRIKNVPFWMPLPEPPKGGAEDG